MSNEILYEVKGPKALDEMAWTEVEEALQKTKCILIPCGSIECHGTHLPLGSDTMQADYMCRLIAKKLAAEGITVIPGPKMGFGNNPDKMPFPGTIHFKPETVQTILFEMCMALYKHGFKQFAFVLGHGGNSAIQELAVQNVVEATEGKAKAISLNWLPVLQTEYAKLITSKKKEGHSGEGETSRMLVHHPNLVLMNRAEVCYPELPAGSDIPFNKRPAYGGGVSSMVYDFRDMTRRGVMGDPTLATVETGNKIYEFLCNWMVKVIKSELLNV